MPSHLRAGTIPLLALLSSSFAVACGGTREVPVVYVNASEASLPNGGASVDAQPAPPAARADRVRIGEVAFDEPAAPAAAAPSGPVGWEEAPTRRFADGPYAGCEVRRYDSGWIVGRCGELELFVQAGYAATTGPSTLRGVAGDRVSGFVEERPLVLGGRRVPAADILRRQRKPVETLIGTEMRLDPEGEILHRGLHARVRTPRSGAVGATCHADVGEWDESACVRLIETIAEHGLPGGPITERRLNVAGVALDFSGERCWAPSPGEVYCFLDGGMTWASGSPARMDALREQSIRNAPLAPRSEAERQRSADRLNANRERIHMATMASELQRTGRIRTTEPPVFHPDEFPRMRVERSEHACRIGGVESACTRVDYYGALEHVAEYAYYARVPTERGETLVHCRHSHTERAPSPCRQVFGDFVVSP